MKKSDIKVGGYYQASVTGHIVTVRVDRIDVSREVYQQNRVVTSYRLTNLMTGVRLTFESARKFRLEVNETEVPA